MGRHGVLVVIAKNLTDKCRPKDNGCVLWHALVA